MQRVIGTSSGTVTLGQYVAAWKLVKSVPPGQMFKSSLCSKFPTRASDILGQFRYGLHDRINRHVPGYGKGRKWSQQWQDETFRAASEINRPRLRIYWLPADLRHRFAHRLCRYDD